MNWINNLISYANAGNPGKCPNCGSERVRVQEHTHGERKSVSFTCEQCKSADHFDGMANEKIN